MKGDLFSPAEIISLLIWAYFCGLASPWAFGLL